jgi:hypothetical protein
MDKLSMKNFQLMIDSNQLDNQYKLLQMLDYKSHLGIKCIHFLNYSQKYQHHTKRTTKMVISKTSQ